VGARRPSRIAQLTVLSKDGNFVTNINEKADIFSKRYQVPLGYHPTRDPQRRKLLKTTRKKNEENNPPGIDHVPFTNSEARVAREEMSNNKAPGLSRTRKEDLEMGGEAMDALVAHLADKVALSGKWPQILKKGINCPVPKDGDATNIIEEDQTRPITLLEALDKWLQKLFYNRIRAYIDFDERQAGYCLSCDHHTTLVSDFVMNRTNGAFTLAVFTDISKAFDSVPLDELIDTVWSSKMPTPYKWVICSFIEKREFRVEVRDANGNVAASKWRKMIYGTPQGSVLGPLLWNLFFDPLLKKLAETGTEATQTETAQDISSPSAQETTTEREGAGASAARELDPDSGTTNPAAHADSCAPAAHATNRLRVTRGLDNLDTAYADDLTLLAASNNPKQAETLLEKKLEIFKNFLTDRGMKAASHKLKIMCLDPLGRDYTPIVHYDGKPIQVVDEHKFLGIYYDKHMTFEKHWEYVTTSLINRTKALSRLLGAKWGPTQQTAKVLHKSYLESRVRYGLLAWYVFLEPRLKEKLESQLRRAIRIVMGLSLTCLTEALMAESDLDSVADLALKCAVSFYARINPTDSSQTTLVKKYYIKKKPIWSRLLESVPQYIWKGPIQARLEKKVLLAADSVRVMEKTIHTQKQANEIESNFSRILYTDASMVKTSDPPGKAAIGYIWYRKTLEDTWEEESRGSATIGTGHSSYSAEAIAIRIGLESDPTQDGNNEGTQEWTTQMSDAESTEVDLDHSTADSAHAAETRAHTTKGGCATIDPKRQSDQNSSQARVHSVGVFTDSLSNLSTIKRGVAETQEQEALLRTIAQNPNNLTFHHVKSHQDNEKNNAVDKLCNVNTNPPGRTNKNYLQGKKTASTIKCWTDKWISNRRLAKLAENRKLKRRKSATQKWMLGCLKDEHGDLTLRPKIQNQLPRREGVLIAKAKTNRWTSCWWFIHFIKKWPSPLCITCKTEDTTEHAINECLLHEAPRSLMLEDLRHTGKVSDLLSSKSRGVLDKLAKFLVEIDEDRQDRIKQEQEKRSKRTDRGPTSSNQ